MKRLSGYRGNEFNFLNVLLFFSRFFLGFLVCLFVVVFFLVFFLLFFKGI